MTSVAVSLIMVIVCVALLIFLGMKGVHTILGGLVAAALISFCSPDGFTTAFFSTFPTAFGTMCQNFFFLFVVGGCFGGVLEATGATEAIGKGFVKAFGQTNWYWPLIVANMLLAATGAVPFVLMSYISFGLAKRANCPKYVCLVAIAGTMVISQQVLPGTTTLNNLLTSNALGVTIYAGATVGIITGIIGVILVGLYINYLIKDARKKGIGYDESGNEGKLRDDDDLPNFWASLIPLLVLLAFVFWFVFIKKGNGTQGVVYGTVIGTLLLYLLNFKHIHKGTNVLLLMSKQIAIIMPGMVGACVMYGFATVVGTTSAVSSLASGLANSGINPYIVMWLGTMIMVAIMANGSSGALSFIAVFKDNLLASGVSLEAAQRLICITSASWDTLPHNSFVNAMIPLFGYDVKSGYKYLLVSNCILPTVYSLIALVLTLIIH